MRQPATCSGPTAAGYRLRRPGRVAQRESARFTRGRSLVRSQSRPSRNQAILDLSAGLVRVGDFVVHLT
jgi:hypothetical protein